ncbi:MAG: hypothetical protein ACRER1_02940 [Gammaproteobacteria bacterium]
MLRFKNIGRLLMASLPLLAACSLGPQPPQVTGVAQAPIDPHAVKLYLPECKPLAYQTVAKLDASKLGIFSSYDFNLKWLDELREQAADIGANGVLLTETGGAQTWGATRHGPVFKAQAIRESVTQAPTAGTSMWAESCARVAKLLRYRSSNVVPGSSNVGRVGGSERSGGG